MKSLKKKIKINKKKNFQNIRKTKKKTKKYKKNLQN